MNTKLILTIVISVAVIGGLVWLLISTPANKAVPASDIATTTDASAVDTPAKTQSAPALTTSGAGARTFEKGVYVTTVYFTNQGFVPQNITITHGEEVRFVNKTTLTMRVGSQVAANSSSTFYSAISDPRAEPKGGTYQISFTQPGVWSYYSMTGDPYAGVVTVK